MFWVGVTIDMTAKGFVCMHACVESAGVNNILISVMLGQHSGCFYSNILVTM